MYSGSERMGGEAADLEKRLMYDAALTGDVTNTTTPLHMATLRGNLGIVEEVLKRNPQLARQLDSQKSSPLHIAAAEGYVEIASMLLSAAPNMCWRRDYQGMNPVHIAAMNGHVEILQELLRLDHFPAMEKANGGQTVLHLCVKHGQLKALELLVEILDDHLVSAEDDEGDTVLHFAVRCNQIEMIAYLVEENKIEKTKVNSKGKSAADILKEIPPNTSSSSKIRGILSVSAWPLSFNEIQVVIAVLIAAMAFQAVVSPPGGVWQGDSSTHRAGTAVMAYTHPKVYKQFVRANTVAFVSSLISIFLFTTGLSSITYTMWVSLASIAVSFGASVIAITPNTQTQTP